MFRYLVNWLLVLLPVSGFFKFKRFILGLTLGVLGKGACVNGHTWFYGRGEINIGANTWIGPHCRFYSDASATISIGEKCDIAPEVAFVVGSHEIGDENRRAGIGYCKSIIIEDGCWIGARATIHGGVTIGHGAVIGAGSLVLENVPANTLVVGVPAKVKKCLK